MVIEDSIAFYLDVCGQFICLNNQFRNNETFVYCSSPYKKMILTIRSACFEGSRLILCKPKTNCAGTNSIIYEIRCRMCTPKDSCYNVSYVGQVEKESSVHVWVSSDFRGTMEMIYLPTTSNKDYYNRLTSRECFWQFFCRVLRGGWCTDFPKDPVKTAARMLRNQRIN